MRREEMRVGDLVLAGLLVGLGLVLHGVFPGVLAGMKPDFSLVMLFVVILLVEDRKVVAITGVATAIITALTTTFPMGQIPNIVDKLITTAVVVGMASILPKNVLAASVGAVGTLVSGSVFLGTAALLTGLPTSFASLMAVVVLPAAGVNTVALLILYPLAAKLYRMQMINGLQSVRQTK